MIDATVRDLVARLRPFIGRSWVDPSCRLILLCMSVGLLVYSGNLRPPYPFATLWVPGPWLWQGAFLIAGMALVGWAARPTSPILFSASWLAVFVVVPSRMLGLALLSEPVPWAPIGAWLFAWTAAVAVMPVIAILTGAAIAREVTLPTGGL